MTTTTPDNDKDHDLSGEYSFEHPWPWHVESHLRDLVDDGLTPGQMAAAMGCTAATVYRYLDRHGIDLSEVGA
ncbi:hypothetical protein [Halostella pelagica]|uniref:hypothetical protein n=1 Tax=Halostella pelagica TaxID=2583824 RepID=UPI001082298F|nr:hypothetical protein [Halostella pelagica]